MALSLKEPVLSIREGVLLTWTPPPAPLGRPEAESLHVLLLAGMLM